MMTKPAPTSIRGITVRGLGLLLTAMVTVGVSACGPITPTPQPAPTLTPAPPAPTPTPTPPPTKSPEQLAAEQKVLDLNQVYWAAISGQGDPNRLYQVVRNRDGGPEGYVASYFKMYSTAVGAGLKAVGERPVTVVSSTAPGEADGRRMVLVAACIDNRAWSFEDKKGKKIPAEAVIEPVTFEVQQWPSDGWFVVGEKDGQHTCAS